MTHTSSRRSQKKHSRSWKRTAAIGSFGALCAVLSFAIGIQTSGTVRTLERTQAALTGSVRGDMDDDGLITVSDVILVLERVDGLEETSSADLQRGDVDGDFRLTAKDALRLLRTLER